LPWKRRLPPPHREWLASWKDSPHPIDASKNRISTVTAASAEYRLKVFLDNMQNSVYQCETRLSG
jgi:hypothetical protein